MIAAVGEFDAVVVALDELELQRAVVALSVVYLLT